MKKLAIIYIEKQCYQNLTTQARVRNEIYDEILAKLVALGPHDPRSRRFTSFSQVALEIGSPLLAEIQQLLVAEGLQPVAWNRMEYSSKTAWDSRFYRYSDIREYTQADIDSAPFLRVREWFGLLTSAAGRDGERWIGNAQFVKHELEMEYAPPPGGKVGQGRTFFVNEIVRQAIEQSGFAGARFHPLQWDNPQLTDAVYHEVDTPYVMPPCMLPLEELPRRAGFSPSLYYYEGAFVAPDVELQFSKAAVEAMGPFDLAWAPEDLSMGSINQGKHELIISQRLYRFLRQFDHYIEESNRTISVECSPIRLV